MSVILPFLALLLAAGFAAYHRLRLAVWAAITASLLVAGWLPPMPFPVDPQYRTASAFARLKAFLQIAYGISLLGRP